MTFSLLRHYYKFVRIKVIALVLASLTLTQMATTADASVKAGSVCARSGVKSVVSGYKYTCIKSGHRLLWSKAVKIAVNTSIGIGNY